VHLLHSERYVYASADDDIRVRYNVFETIKPAYHGARYAGANVSVHREDFVGRGHAERMDATELYDLDAEAWIGVCNATISKTTK
jgi:hypothetical protein